MLIFLLIWKRTENVTQNAVIKTQAKDLKLNRGWYWLLLKNDLIGENIK